MICHIQYAWANKENFEYGHLFLITSWIFKTLHAHTIKFYTFTDSQACGYHLFDTTTLVWQNISDVNIHNYLFVWYTFTRQIMPVLQYHIVLASYILVYIS